MANKRKIATSMAAVGMAAALLLGGTFAWQSISQRALNEATDIINPGGRLHNDMWYVSAEENNNDIYVENFTDADTGDEIFARVRLEEYMEIVLNHGTTGEKEVSVIGTKTEQTDEDGNTVYDYEYVTFTGYDTLDEGKVTAGVNGGGVYDDTALEGEAGYPYWTWKMGGESVYMPTFNMNKDSLAADLNGLYVDRVGGISNRGAGQYERYNESGGLDNLGELGEVYDGYVDGQGKTANEIWDYDSDTEDELVNLEAAELADIINPNITIADDYNATAEDVQLVEETHYAQPTGTAQLISMSAWLDMVWEDGGYDPDFHGGYWVYDDTLDDEGNMDGWVYWSAPIQPQTATGLLLDGITLNQVMDDTWYYAINVVGQFVTADDAGKGNDTGFYDTTVEGNTVPSDNAETMLETIGVVLDGSTDDDNDDDDWTPPPSTIDLYPDDESELVGGDFRIFEATVYDENSVDIAYTSDVTFSVTEVTASGASTMSIEETTMDGNVLLVADDIIDRGVTEVIVSATYTDGENTYEGEYTFTVAAADSPLEFTLSIDGEPHPQYRENEWQLFPAYPVKNADDEAVEYQLGATLNDTSATVTWSLVDSGMYYAKYEDGIYTGYADGDWNVETDDGVEEVPADTAVLQLDENTGLVTFLIENDQCPRGMQVEVTATEADAGYTESVFIGIYYVNADFSVYDTEQGADNVAASRTTYTDGESLEVVLGFELSLYGESVDIDTSKISNWKIADWYSEDEAVDVSEYVTVDPTTKTATVSIPVDEYPADAESLSLMVEYEHGVIGPRNPNGISEATFTFMNSEYATDEVDDVTIIDYNTGEDYAVYTPGTYQKFYLTATPTADGEEVYSGTVTWSISSHDNVYLKKADDGSFEAEVWFLNAGNVGDVTVHAAYQNPGETGIQASKDFVIRPYSPYTVSVTSSLTNYDVGYANTAILTAAVTDENGEEVSVTEDEIVWSVSDSDSFTDGDLSKPSGETSTLGIKAEHRGSVTVTATYQGAYSGSVVIEANPEKYTWNGAPQVASIAPTKRTWSGMTVQNLAGEDVTADVEVTLSDNQSANTTLEKVTADDGSVTYTLTFGTDETAEAVTLTAVDDIGRVDWPVSIKYTGTLMVGPLDVDNGTVDNLELYSSPTRAMTYSLGYNDYWGNADNSVSYELSWYDGNQEDTKIEGSTLTLAAGEDAAVIVWVKDSNGDNLVQYICEATIDKTAPTFEDFAYGVKFSGISYTHKFTLENIAGADYGVNMSDTMVVKVYELTENTTEATAYTEENIVVTFKVRKDRDGQGWQNVTPSDGGKVYSNTSTNLVFCFNYTLDEDDTTTTHLGIVVTDRAGNTNYAAYPVADPNAAT